MLNCVIKVYNLGYLLGIITDSRHEFRRAVPNPGGTIAQNDPFPGLVSANLP
jgi:hypothetical protein